jgi:hypothetical protein
MWVSRPLAQVGTKCGEEGLGAGGAEPRDGDQISPCHPEERRTGVANGGVVAGGLRCAGRRGGPRRWGRLRGGGEARLPDGEGAFDLSVTFAAGRRRASGQSDAPPARRPKGAGRDRLRQERGGGVVQGRP